MEGKNFIRDLNPITQLYLCLFIAVSSLFYDYRYTAVLIVVMIAIAAMAGKAGEFVGMWLKSIVLISVVVFVMQALFLPGDTVLWKFWIFSVKQEGIDNAVTLCTRIMGVGTAAVLGIKLVDVGKLVVALEDRGVSPSATYVIMSTVNIIPQMSKKMTVIMDAQRSRGVDTESNMFVRAKAFFPTIGPLILNSIVSAEERAITLEARAFSVSGKKTRLHTVADTGTDRALRVVFMIMLAAAVGGRIITWIV